MQTKQFFWCLVSLKGLDWLLIFGSLIRNEVLEEYEHKKVGAFVSEPFLKLLQIVEFSDSLFFFYLAGT